MFENPFTPNFGQIPPYIAGRDDIISDMEDFLDNARMSNPTRSSILIGARGTGKTALLSYFSEYAKGHGWLSINVTCIPGMQEDILQQSAKAAAELISGGSNARISGISLGQLFGVTWDNPEPEEMNWRLRFSNLMDKLEEYDTGIFLTIDEVNPGLDEMIQVASVYQLWVRENRKIAIMMAGLPGEVLSLLNDRSVSFLRRSTQYELGRIDDHEIAYALKKTVNESGKKIEEAVINKAVDAINGFPYMMQLVGYRSWQQSEKNTEITESDMESGINLAKKDFESRVLKATVDELSDTDRAFLYSMLPDAKITSVSDLEKRMGKNSGYISKYRSRLLAQGIIRSPRRGYVEFDLPGIKEYLQKNMYA